MELSRLLSSDLIKGDTNELKAFKFKHFLPDDKYLDLNNALVLDAETYNFNAQIRLAQFQDINEKRVLFFLDGQVKDDADVKLKSVLQQDGYDFTLILCDSELELVKNVSDYLVDTAKPIIGHNIAGFDLNLLNMKLFQYNIGGIKFNAYTVGSGMAKKHIVFSYSIDDKKESTKSGFEYIMGLVDEEDENEDFLPGEYR